MKRRKMNGHTSTACVNRKCQAYYLIDQMIGWNERRALEAYEIEQILAEAKVERIKRLERIRHKMEKRARKWAKINDVALPITISSS